MERSTEDGTFNGVLSALRRTELSTEYRGTLLKTGLSIEDLAFDAGRNCQLMTERSTEGGTVNSGLNARRKAELLTQDS